MNVSRKARSEKNKIQNSFKKKKTPFPSVKCNKLSKDTKQNLQSKNSDRTNQSNRLNVE